MSGHVRACCYPGEPGPTQALHISRQHPSTPRQRTSGTACTDTDRCWKDRRGFGSRARCGRPPPRCALPGSACECHKTRSGDRKVGRWLPVPVPSIDQFKRGIDKIFDDLPLGNQIHDRQQKKRLVGSTMVGSSWIAISSAISSHACEFMKVTFKHDVTLTNILL